MVERHVEEVMSEHPLEEKGEKKDGKGRGGWAGEPNARTRDLRPVGGGSSRATSSTLWWTTREGLCSTYR